MAAPCRRSANGWRPTTREPKKAREMRGLLADVNLQGHLSYLRRLLETLDLWPCLADLNLQLVTFADLNLPSNLDDRSLWNWCQQEHWVLLTDNRNEDGINSLEATLKDS